MRWLVAFALLALPAGEGCSSKSKTAIDVTIDVDETLGLTAVGVSASATGKPNLDLQFAAADVVRLTIAPTGLVDGTVVTLEARGVKAGATLVLDRTQVHLRLEERVTAELA
jgi:hypothetical protein